LSPRSADPILNHPHPILASSFSRVNSTKPRKYKEMMKMGGMAVGDEDLGRMKIKVN
jgi:hypothetical protein